MDRVLTPKGMYKKSSDIKNSSEMSELERDLSLVQNLSSNFEKQKSYSDFPVGTSRLIFFNQKSGYFVHIWGYVRSDNDMYNYLFEHSETKISKINIYEHSESVFHSTGSFQFYKPSY